MLSIKKSSTYDGKIIINGQDVMSITAYTTGNQITSISSSVENSELYNQHMMEILQEQMDFQKTVFDNIKSEKMSGNIEQAENEGN